MLKIKLTKRLNLSSLLSQDRHQKRPKRAKKSVSTYSQLLIETGKLHSKLQKRSMTKVSQSWHLLTLTDFITLVWRLLLFSCSAWILIRLSREP